MPFQKVNDAQRVIAARELLGSIVAIKVFSGRWQCEIAAGCSVTGATDNKGNSFTVTLVMSTKWSLAVLLLKLSAQFHGLSLERFLQRAPRDDDVEADRLSNMDVAGLDPVLRIGVGPATLKWKAMQQRMPGASELFRKMLEDHESSASKPGATRNANAGGKHTVATLSG